MALEKNGMACMHLLPLPSCVSVLHACQGSLLGFEVLEDLPGGNINVYCRFLTACQVVSAKRQMLIWFRRCGAGIEPPTGCTHISAVSHWLLLAGHDVSFANHDEGSNSEVCISAIKSSGS